MTTRRRFFKEIFGQLGVLRDDIKGCESIPLNRLSELPDNIIENIEPVFFPEKKSYIESVISRKSDWIVEGNNSIKLGTLEHKAIILFLKGMNLRNTAAQLHDDDDRDNKDIYQAVTSFFFKLASLRLCHPRKIYRIDEINRGK